jgi:protein-tyrosine phosphatase
MNQLRKVKVLFVCMGNICRSPTAEGVFRSIVERQGLEKFLVIDSAGTTGFHAGEAPDKRAQAAAKRRGYDLSSIRARSVHPSDFNSFDYILAMDKENLKNLKAVMPSNSRAKVQLFLNYAEHTHIREVPDPYYGGADGFESVLDLIEDASHGLLKEIQTVLDLK